MLDSLLVTLTKLSNRWNMLFCRAPCPMALTSRHALKLSNEMHLKDCRSRKVRGSAA